MWSVGLFLFAQIVVCQFATENPPSSTTPEEQTVTSFYALTTGIVPSPVMLRLGNSTIDSTKSFKVPQPTTHSTEATTSTVRVTKMEIPIVPHVISAKNTYFDHDRRYGPNFEDGKEGNITKMTVQLGEDAHLNCRISLLQDKTVSWVRRRGREEMPELLTVGAVTYAADSRITVASRYPGNWRLLIREVKPDDEGIYDCQISTHPPRVSRTYLHINNTLAQPIRTHKMVLSLGSVNQNAVSKHVTTCKLEKSVKNKMNEISAQLAPQVWVVDEAGAPLSEKYYEAESTLALVCRARDVETPAQLTWLHEGRALNADTTRGGINVKTEQVPGGADSLLRLARVNSSDAGNYTCAVRGARSHTVAVHVLNEESLAELHAGATSKPPSLLTVTTLLVAATVLAERSLLLSPVILFTALAVVAQSLGCEQFYVLLPT